VANIVRRTEAMGVIDATTAAGAIVNLCALPVDLLLFDLLAERVWELWLDLTACDAGYVVLVEALGGLLVALDPELANGSGVRCEVRVAPELATSG
jgi:predicted nucleic acid-binding protein